MTAFPPSPAVFADPAGSSVFLNAARWIEAVLMGPAATSIAVIAIASIGLLMLSGRVNLRRGATVVLGCFILFGAATIARGLQGTALVVSSDHGPSAAVAMPPPPAIILAPPPPRQPNADPYAGAAIRR